MTAISKGAAMTKPGFNWIQIIIGSFALITASVSATYNIVSQFYEAQLISVKKQLDTLSGQFVETKTTLGGCDRTIHDLRDSLARCNAVHPPARIHITSPRRGNNKVSDHADVKFQLTGALPEGFHPIVLVQDPLGQWWPWGNAQHEQSDLWSRTVQIGNQADIGRRFKIWIILTNQDLPQGQQLNEPPSFQVSDVLEVVRQ
jgi:hypothetical protein